MANHASAIKRNRQNVKRRARNQALKTKLRHLVREVRTAIAAQDRDAAANTFSRASRALDKAVTKGLLHRNAAARKVSRLARAVGKLATG